MTQAGNPRYLHLLEYLRYLHIVKAYGYGTADDPLNNLRGSARLGIPPWKGAYIRSEDKLNRIVNLTTRGEGIPSVGERENTLDTMADRMAYDGLALVLFSESIGMVDEEFGRYFEVKPLPDDLDQDREPHISELADLDPERDEVQFDEEWMKLSFHEVTEYLQRWLDAHYPAENFPESDTIRDLARDPGAQFVGTVRAALTWYRKRMSEMGGP